MKMKSDVPDEERDTISLHPFQVYKWLNEIGIKEDLPIEKPFYTPKHKDDRMRWVKDWHNTKSNKNIPIAHLDEKWFYTTNRRRKIKQLSLEKKGDDFIPEPKVGAS